MERVIAYIDGFNLYYGLRAKRLHRFRWLSVTSLAQLLLKPDQQLITARYFTARISGPPASVRRQATYLDALQATGVDVIEGKYQQKAVRCADCGATFSRPEEKQTDVNIAVAMMTDAHLDRYDMALLVSGDSDLTPPVRRIPELHRDKRIVVASPPGRHSHQLAVAAGAHVAISTTKVRQAQLPDPVITSSGHALRRPRRWTRSG